MIMITDWNWLYGEGRKANPTEPLSGIRKVIETLRARWLNGLPTENREQIEVTAKMLNVDLPVSKADINTDADWSNPGFHDLTGLHVPPGTNIADRGYR